ncbi:MAG: HEAT repeat domain-containing protein [Acidobacteria bacterium]|nr:HEAT repeat domain-containing protein [Acidobacteriota bacterium]
MTETKNETRPQHAGRKTRALKLALCCLCLSLALWLRLAPTAAAPPPQSEVEHLLETLEQEQWADWQEPQNAAQKLAEMGSSAVNPIFKAMMASNSNRALYWMEYALYQMAERYATRLNEPQSPMPILIAALDDLHRPYDLRRLAGRLLGKLGDTRAVASLSKNLNDGRVAKDVAHALGQIKSAASRQALVARLTTLEGRREKSDALRLELIEALGQLGDARALPVLRRAASARETTVRSAAVEAMAHIRGAASVAALKQTAAREQDAQVKQALRLSFLRLGQPLPTALEQRADADIKTISCQGCHAQLYTDFITSAHNLKGQLTCVTCHGESIKHQDSYGSRPPDRPYAGATISPLCAQCHEQMNLPTLERAMSGRLRHTFAFRGRSKTSEAAHGETVTLTENFERGGARNWEAVNPTDWRIKRDGNNQVYALFRHFTNGVPRRPVQLSLLKTAAFTDLTFEVRVRRPELKSESLILVFGYQDETHFYYAHLSLDPSSKTLVHNGLFIVDGAPRRRIGTMDAAAILPDTNWHRIKIVRETSSGRIALYVDDATKPTLEALDHRFSWGRIGLGGFHELGDFDDIKITGLAVPGRQ